MKMDKPPSELDGANVLYFSVADSIGLFGIVDYIDEKREEFIQALAICQYDNGKDVYVFACDTEWKVMGDLCFGSVEEAMIEAVRTYSQSPIKWEKVD